MAEPLARLHAAAGPDANRIVAATLGETWTMR
jgi:hypothetical protein